MTAFPIPVAYWPTRAVAGYAAIVLRECDNQTPRYSENDEQGGFGFGPTWEEAVQDAWLRAVNRGEIPGNRPPQGVDWTHAAGSTLFRDRRTA